MVGVSEETVLLRRLWTNLFYETEIFEEVSEDGKRS